MNGPEIEELEAALARRAGVDHAVSCASGTDALVMALMAHGIGPGDAVIVPTFTFAATAEAVALVGATPAFADVSPSSFCLDPSRLQGPLELVRAAGLTPCGIIAVDLFGQPADYDAIHDVAEHHGLWVMADAAQSFGATVAGRPVGGLADVTTTSFFPAKPLGAFGDGGAVLTDDQDYADRLRSIREHGRGADRYEHVRVGLTGRLDTIQAAVLLEKLTIFDDELVARDRIAARYGIGTLCRLRHHDAGGGGRPDLHVGAVHHPGRATVRAGRRTGGGGRAHRYPLSPAPASPARLRADGRGAGSAARRRGAEASACCRFPCTPISPRTRSGGSRTRCGDVTARFVERQAA